MGRLREASRVLFGKPVVPQRGEIGTDTFPWEQLHMDRDDNPELAGSIRYRTYDRMWISDVLVRSLAQLVPQPIIAANWRIMPVDEGRDPVDRIVAAACEEQLGLGDRDGFLLETWEAALGQSMMCLTYGSMAAELVWGEAMTWTPEDGAGRLLMPIRRLAPRWPHTIDPDLGYHAPPPGSRLRVERIKQELVEEEIPGDKILLHVLNPAAGRFVGSAMIRPCYGPWTIKQAAIVTWAIGFDRFAVGIPLIMHPDGEQRAAHALGRSLRSHERAVVTLPDIPGDGASKWQVSLLNGASTLADPIPMLNFLNHEIADAGLTGWSRLGTTATGSRAVGEVQVEPFYLAEQALANQLANDYQDQVLARFVAVNFGSDVRVPKLVCEDIREEAVGDVIRQVRDLSDAGIDMGDLETANWLRRKIKAPEVDEVPKKEGTAPFGFPTGPQLNLFPEADAPEPDADEPEEPQAK